MIEDLPRDDPTPNPLPLALLATAWSLVFRGFEGARWSDVPIVKSFVDPRLYARDPFITTLHEGTPAAYAYQLIAAVVAALRFLPFDAVLFVLYLPATLAALFVLAKLGFWLTGDRLATALLLALYVAGFRLVTVGSAILHAAETTPAMLALPFQLGGLYAAFRGRGALGGILMGVALNLHIPTTVYMGAAFAIYQLACLRRIGLKTLVLSGALAALVGGPALVGSLLAHADSLPRWALSLARAELATDISFAINFSSRPYVIRNVLGLALLALALRHAPPGEPRRATWIVLAGVGLMCLLAFVNFDLTLASPLSTLVARLQFPRSAWLLDVLGLAWLAAYLALRWRQGGPDRATLLLLVATMLGAKSDFLPLDPLFAVAVVLALVIPSSRRPAVPPSLRLALPFAAALVCLLLGLRGTELREFDFGLSVRSGAVFIVLAVAWGLHELLKRRTARLAWAVAPAALVATLGTATVERGEELAYQRAHRGGLAAAAAFQDWARTETPVDSVFLILPSEPNNNDFYERAERAIFLVRERANQAVYFPRHSDEFARRVAAMGIDQPLRYREELDPAFRRLTEEQVRRLAREFGVTHFVPARAGSFSFPVVYQSGGWTVYKVE